MKKLVALCLCLSLLLSPPLALAQTPSEPGQDPFALSDELLRFFGMEPTNPQSTDDTGSLFGGDNMVNYGLFAPSTTQLGGATPLTAPIRDNQDNLGPTRIMLTSRYEPTGDITSQHAIKITITAKNVGDNPTRGLVLTAKLADSNADLLPQDGEEPAPTGTPSGLTPEPPNPPISDDSDIDDPEVGLIWTRKADSSSFNLDVDESADFVFYVKAHRDDSILRWTFEITYASGVSTLLQWIPIKNPNPSGALAPGQSNGASGIPLSCNSTASGGAPFPDSASNQEIVTQVGSRWQIDLKDESASWLDGRYKSLLKVLWETLSAVECTPYLTEIKNKNGGRIALTAVVIPQWHYGEYVAGARGIILDLNKITSSYIDAGAPEKATWILIHELGHAYNNDRYDSPAPAYWTEYSALWSSYGGISTYGAGSNTENIADVFGYYVARCAADGGGPNPYASSAAGRQQYYEFAKKIFGGQEFGPPAPASVTCSNT